MYIVHAHMYIYMYVHVWEHQPTSSSWLRVLQSHTHVHNIINKIILAIIIFSVFVVYIHIDNKHTNMLFSEQNT